MACELPGESKRCADAYADRCGSPEMWVSCYQIDVASRGRAQVAYASPYAYCGRSRRTDLQELRFQVVREGVRRARETMLRSEGPRPWKVMGEPGEQP
eukprot:103312-Rhodomonas_salina.1